MTVSVSRAQPRLASIAARPSARGFTLIELIAVIVILGSLAAVATPAFLDLRRSAYDAGNVATAGALKAGLANARMAWGVAPNGGVELSGAVGLNSSFGGGAARFTAAGHLMGTSAGTTLTHARCLEIWQLALGNSVIASAGEWSTANFPGSQYVASAHALGFCIYVRLNAQGTLVFNIPGNVLYIGYDPFGTVWPPAGSVFVNDQNNVFFGM